MGRERVERRSRMLRSEKLTFKVEVSWAGEAAGRLGERGGSAGACCGGGTNCGTVCFGGGMSMSIASGVAGACGEIGVLLLSNRGFSSAELPSSTTAALPPSVGLKVVPVRFLTGTCRGGGGANVCGLNVSAHSCAENFVPPGDSTIGSPSTTFC